jgi:hypothetical protein
MFDDLKSTLITIICVCMLAIVAIISIGNFLFSTRTGYEPDWFRIHNSKMYKDRAQDTESFLLHEAVEDEEYEKQYRISRWEQIKTCWRERRKVK